MILPLVGSIAGIVGPLIPVASVTAIYYDLVTSTFVTVPNAFTIYLSSPFIYGPLVALARHHPHAFEQAEMATKRNPQEP